MQVIAEAGARAAQLPDPLALAHGLAAAQAADFEGRPGRAHDLRSLAADMDIG